MLYFRFSMVTFHLYHNDGYRFFCKNIFVFQKNAYLSLWNFKLCMTWGTFWRIFHKCIVSSAVTVTNLPSLTINSERITAHADSPSWLTWVSTPGRPNLWIERESERKGIERNKQRSKMKPGSDWNCWHFFSLHTILDFPICRQWLTAFVLDQMQTSMENREIHGERSIKEII